MRITGQVEDEVSMRTLSVLTTFAAPFFCCFVPQGSKGSCDRGSTLLEGC